jgi:hypothetical protein
MVAGTTSVTSWCVGEQRYLGPHAHSVIDTVHRVWTHNEGMVGNGREWRRGRGSWRHCCAFLDRAGAVDRIQCPEFGSDVGGRCGRIHRLGRDVGESRPVTGAVACRRWFFHHAAPSANQAAARVVHCSAWPARLPPAGRSVRAGRRHLRRCARETSGERSASPGGRGWSPSGASSVGEVPSRMSWAE